MRCRLLVALLTLSACALPAQRIQRSLTGVWQIRPLTPAAGPWQPIRVPSTFESALGTDFDGVAEYRREIDPTTFGRLERTDRVEVRFAAVATHARVFFNDTEIGTHLGGWTPFRCEIPSTLFAAPTWTLRVVVDERVGHNTQGFLPIIAPHFGGIWQKVEVIRHRGPTLNPDDLILVPSWDAEARGVPGVPGRARLTCSYRGQVPPGTSLGYVFCMADQRYPVATDNQLPIAAQPWRPESPHRYLVKVRLTDQGGAVLDEVDRWVAFVSVAAAGRKILVNGKPIQIRGVLHWGYEPPSLAPHRDLERWLRQFRYLKAAGFNLVKACLWFPPPEFFAAAEEVGLFVWQEYPTWHPDFSKKHLPDLLREYDEFFHLDRQRSTILARSLTCETGRAVADATVIETLFRRCKEVTGAALVEDDSSWISWNRFHDFYDDHPYGNCGPWLGRLDGFDQYIEKNGAKPFLLGEAIASDTWVPEKTLADPKLSNAWWRPFAVDAQRRFVKTVTETMGAPAAAALVPDSLAYAMRARRYQIEAFRRRLPDAGYVVSVIRDFRKARMGLFDDLDQPKWSAEDFRWHRRRMFLLDDARAIRSIGKGRAEWRPRLVQARDPEWIVTRERYANGAWHEAAGDEEAPRAVFRHRVQPKQRHPGWVFYELPTASAEAPDGVRVATRLDAATLAWVEKGGRLLLTPEGPGSLRHQGLWFLRGAPYAPVEHPLFRRVPRDALFALQPFDFDGPVLVDTPLIRSMQKILGFWDTHDQLETVDTYTFLAEARLGSGRVLACSLNLSPTPERGLDAAPGAEAPNPARAWLRARLLEHLATGPAPDALVPASLVAGLRQQLASRQQELAGEWRLKADTGDVGLEQGWQAVEHDDTGWLAARAGIHWEKVGLEHHNGVGWYRKHFDAPEFWRPNAPLFAEFDGVDDSYVLFVNGKRVAEFGNPETGETVWLVKTHADISKFVVPGKNVMALRVVDHQGAGGLHRGVRLTTADPSVEPMLQR